MALGTGFYKPSISSYPTFHISLFLRGGRAHDCISVMSLFQRFPKGGTLGWSECDEK